MNDTYDAYKTNHTGGTASKKGDPTLSSSAGFSAIFLKYYFYKRILRDPSGIVLNMHMLTSDDCPNC